MKLHELSPAAGSKKSVKRIGRGPASGQGKTAGKGHKGQKARAGRGMRPGFEGGQMPLQRRLPKRGFVNISGKEFAIVNKTLDGVKVLAHGDITKKFTVKVNAYSDAAKAKIEAAGGKAEVI